MLLAGGAAGVLWLIASHSKWELALAILATVVAGLSLYWMIAALIPFWPFGPVSGTGVETSTGPKPVIAPVGLGEYWSNLAESKNKD
jgi:hypothetical protein